ncbi:NGG1p interacting factor NIF3 [Patescibacteria group bacterium]|nr:NGG1p interacting factor NIF3 [Patescibacteria group bacterium]MBU4512179.1 NGG1p interacting factor NIF3 [Patescibacteria group bacterium]MCG2693486.1 NGG1p interacting factor NIF3 [Candidatus Parcubacteria bacterium]
MTIQQIYNLAIQMGKRADLRDPGIIKKKLKRAKEKYEKLIDDEKEQFDQEGLTNPYADSRIFTNNPTKQVKRMLVGVDIETGEVMLANELGKQGRPIDLIMSHHPLGIGLAGLHEVMDLQVELLAKYGVPINIAEGLTKLRLSEVGRNVSGANHNKSLDAAKILGLPVMCVHTPCDNLVADFLDKEIKKNKDKIERLEDLITVLKMIPEYKEAAKMKAGPTIFTGNKENYCGKIALTEITGGTSGSKDMYEKMSQAGIGTIVGMHMQEEWKRQAEKYHINVVIAGHMASDSIDVNLFLDELEKKGVEIVPCSGLIRYSRVKNTRTLKHEGTRA